MQRKFIFVLIILPVLLSCHNKRTTLNENPNATSTDFIDAFPAVSLPYEITDRVLTHEQNDSFFVNFKTFTNFFPDSIITRHFGKFTKPRFYLLGKAQALKNEYYLVFNAIAPEKRISFISCYTRDKKFSAARILFSEQDQGYHTLATLDSKYTIIITHQHVNSSGESIYRKEDYIYNDAAADKYNNASKFMLILTETNDPTRRDLAVINPLDTLPKKHRFSGDYVQDKRNFISVRDMGKDPSRFMFFIHFEKENGGCKGELKGSAKFSGSTIAQYHSHNDPCGVQFTFKENQVYMKEISPCGSHRDITCLFEGVYARRKDLKKTNFKKSK